MDNKLDKPFVYGFYYDVYVTLETAKLLKEAKFESPVRVSVTEYTVERSHEEDGTSGPFGWEKGELELSSDSFRNNSDHDYSNESYTCYALPTQTTTQMWLRQVHGIKVWVTPNSFDSSGKTWAYNVVAYDNGKLVCDVREIADGHTEFEEALELGLICALEQLIKIQKNNTTDD